MANPSGLSLVIQSPCTVFPAFDPSTVASVTLKSAQFSAIWDTGATHTAITQEVIDALGLKPITMRKVHHAGGEHYAEVFSINVALPNGVSFKEVSATRCQLPPGTQVLIGMDIITIGDFAITNKDGRTVCSFRTPSMVCIDFVKDHQRETLNERFKHGGSKKNRKERHKKHGKHKK